MNLIPCCQILVLVDIKFEDEVQALLLLSSLPNGWFGHFHGND